MSSDTPAPHDDAELQTLTNKKFSVFNQDLIDLYFDDSGKKAIEAYAAEKASQAEVAGRISSLLDLEQWIKLHDLKTDMILDGIEHMCISQIQVPDQQHLNHSERIAELRAALRPSNSQEGSNHEV